MESNKIVIFGASPSQIIFAFMSVEFPKRCSFLIFLHGKNSTENDVIFVENLLSEYRVLVHNIYYPIDTKELDRMIEQFSPDRLYSAMPLNKLDSFLASRYYYIPVFQYDDGLGSLVNESIGGHLFLRRTNRILSYIRAFILSIGKNPSFRLPKLRIRRLSSTIERLDLEVLLDFRNKINIGHQFDELDCVLLGQNFYTSNNLDWNRELSIYREIINDLQKCGFNVYWKEHPKNTRSFAQHLKDVTIIDGMAGVPVELILAIYPDLSVAGLTSTALLIASQNNRQVVCYSHLIKPFLTGRDFQGALVLEKALNITSK